MMPRSVAAAPTAASRSTGSSRVGGAERASPAWSSVTVAEALRQVDGRSVASPRTALDASATPSGVVTQSASAAAAKGTKYFVPASAAVARSACAGSPVARERRVVPRDRHELVARRTTSPSSASCPPAAASSAAREHRRRGAGPAGTTRPALLAHDRRARSAPSPWPPRVGGHDEAEVAHLGELRATAAARSRAARAPSRGGSARAAHALAKKSRVELRRSCWSSESSNFIGSVLRQAEHALGDDVALHLGRAGVDGAGARPEELARPVDVGPRARARAQELAAGPEEVERGLAEALVELAPEDLLDRRLGARAPCRRRSSRACARRSRA